MFDPTTADLTFLEPFFHAATQHASIAIGRWTNGQVKLSLDDVHDAPIEEIVTEMGFDESVQTMVALGVQGEAGGHLILSFDEENGRKFAASLCNRPPSEGPQWSALEQSAVMETGNIFASAYLCELTRLTNHTILPTAPSFIQDFGVCVVEQALMTQAMQIENALICRTRFEFNEQVANWNVYFVPDETLLQFILHADVPKTIPT